MGEQDWYSNKDLFELINGLKDTITNEISDFRVELGNAKGEMAQTRQLIKQYNGLRERMDNYKKWLIGTVIASAGLFLTLLGIILTLMQKG